MIGPGGAGKTSTLDSISGKEFVEERPSTVGATMQTCELERRDLAIGTNGGSPLREWKASAEGEHVRAIAACAALDPSKPGQSMLMEQVQDEDRALRATKKQVWAVDNNYGVWRGEEKEV